MVNCSDPHWTWQMHGSSWPPSGKKGRMTDTLWLPGKDTWGCVKWSVPGATRSVWHSMLAKRVFYAQQAERLGHQPVSVKRLLAVPVIYLFCTCFQKQLLLSHLSFSCQVCSSTVAPPLKWRPACLAPASHLTADQSASQRCPPHNSPSPAPKPVRAVSITTIALGMHICCMTVTHSTPWSLNFRVQVTWKCWRRQISHVQHFNGSPCATIPQNSSPSFIAVSHIRDRFPWGTSKGKKRSNEWQTETAKAKFKANRVWFFTQGIVKLWKYLMKDIVEIIYLSGFGENWTNSWKKNPSLFHPCKYCILETKHSLGGEALSSLHLPAFESLLLYGQKGVKKLPTRWIFIFTSPKPLSASQSCCILTSNIQGELVCKFVLRTT